MNHSEKVARSWVEEVEAAAVECHRLARQYWADHGGVGHPEAKQIARLHAIQVLTSFANDDYFFIVKTVSRYREALQYVAAAWLASYYSARLQSWAVEFIEEAAN